MSQDKIVFQDIICPQRKNILIAFPSLKILFRLKRDKNENDSATRERGWFRTGHKPIPCFQRI